jgi:hypothetical protein
MQLNVCYGISRIGVYFSLCRPYSMHMKQPNIGRTEGVRSDLFILRNSEKEMHSFWNKITNIVSYANARMHLQTKVY